MILIGPVLHTRAIPCIAHSSSEARKFRAAFAATAWELTSPKPSMTVRKTDRGSGGDSGCRLTTGALADNYIRLCHDPCSNLERWIFEESRFISSSRAPPPSPQDFDHVRPLQNSHHLEIARRFCGKILHAVQGWLDAQGKKRISHGMSSRSRAGPSGNDQLRPVRTARQAGAIINEAASQPGDIGPELEAVGSYYASRIEAVRKSARAGDVTALVRAIQIERHLAMRSVIDRWKADSRNTGEHRPSPISYYRTNKNVGQSSYHL